MSQNESRGKSDPAELEAHPIADLFPLLEGKEFDELVEDIRKNGLRMPIVLHPDGRVLDGRSRGRACRKAGVEPRFEAWDGKGSALELVVSLNLRRRHLNESQRAMVAARLKEKLAEEARKSARTRGISTANWRSGTSAEQAAALLNVSPRSVERAAQLLKGGDRRLIVLVESGKLAVSAAAEAPKPKARRPRRSVPAPAADEMMLALWTPPDRVEDAVKLIAQWGFEPRGKPEPKLPLIATRRNPLAPPVSSLEDAGGGNLHSVFRQLKG